MERERSVPTIALGGPTFVAIATDGGEWTALPEAAIPPTGPFAAAVFDGDDLVVARWEPSVIRLRAGAWDEVALSAAVLALASTRRGLVAGDAAGSITLVPAVDGAPARAIAARAPVVELRAQGDVLAALDADGGLSVTRWPVDLDAALAPVDTEAIGRVHALFEGPRGTIAVAGRAGLGLLDGGRLARVTRELGDLVRLAAPFGDGDLCAIGDDGGAWILDEGLDVTGRARLPHEARIAGVVGDGHLALAWTTDGALVSIGADARVRHQPGELVRGIADAIERGRPSWN